ncbi:MAG: KamA family protein [Bacteroidales bacterium]|nr:KamA family protein [Bacteroidales bacterium]
MSKKNSFESVKIDARSQRLVNLFLSENPEVEKIFTEADDEREVYAGLRKWILDQVDDDSIALSYYSGSVTGRKAYKQVDWSEFAAIRILDYIDHEGVEYVDPNLREERYYNHPFRILWLAVRYGKGGAKPAFFEDMLHLFRQANGKSQHNIPDDQKVREWMDRHPSGLDEQMVKMRQENKERIIRTLIRKMDEGEITSTVFVFDPSWSEQEKYNKMVEWWDSRLFHLKFAIRSPELLNEMLGFSLDTDTMDILYQAREAGIPFFVNPYYLSLLNTRKATSYVGADLPIRDYILYSRQLVDEFGHIVAWEKEDMVEPGKPNAAGWLLPEGHNIHRRYPDVAILIPDSMGRACGGLCTSCQRMYDFQSGNLNFNLDKLKPRETWPHKLDRLMQYFRNDTQLRDILITGGDALMSSDKSLQRILDAVYEMARQKKEDNHSRADGEKYAEMLRVRLGTRLPIYLPQRITGELIQMLYDFKEKATAIGIRQFVIQTHFETAMEVTPESREAVHKLIEAGWVVTNQQVFTAAASRRGHTAKLRKVLNEIGVLPYYTFSVKGFMENYHNFATNARSVQEQMEEKRLGEVSRRNFGTIRHFTERATEMPEQVQQLLKDEDKPFLGTDRNVLNMPGVGKSSTFRTIGLTREGRRILEFDHDATRRHSPVVNKMGKITIVESKSISDYMKQLEDMGEDVREYVDLWGYSMGETEERMPVYEYPGYDFTVTDELSNFSMTESEVS